MIYAFWVLSWNVFLMLIARTTSCIQWYCDLRAVTVNSHVLSDLPNNACGNVEYRFISIMGTSHRTFSSECTCSLKYMGTSCVA